MPGTSNSGGRNAIGPTSHVMRGTFQRSRHAGHAVPEPPRGTPEPPEPLTGKAKAEWGRMVGRLTLNGALSVVDDAALYQYVKLYAETEQIDADQHENRKLSRLLKKAVTKDLAGPEARGVCSAPRRAPGADREGDAPSAARAHGHSAVSRRVRHDAECSEPGEAPAGHARGRPAEGEIRMTIIGDPSVTKPAPRRNVRRHQPWWGPGEPPHERWPGVSLRFDPEWSSARTRWETDAGRFYFDRTAADHAQNFFPLFLTHHIGEFDGMPFVLREDQAKLLTRPIFGWKRDGLRRFRKVFAFCVKGWGKSPWGAGTGIYLARYDHEPAAEVYSVAADTKQGRICHDNAKIMVEHSPELFAGCEILRDSIVWSATHSAYLVISSDASTKHGFRPHAVIFDEMHAQRNRDLFEALLRSMVKRRQPLMVMISHAGTDDEGICFEEYDLAKRVLVSNVNLETTLPVIFEMTPTDDWTDPVVWQRINPGHGTTVKHDAIVQECQEAQAEPRKLNDFLRYHGNRWTNQATSWIPVDWWDHCQGEIDEAELVTLEGASGFDLAQKYDLACFCPVFRRYLPNDAADQVEVIAEETSGALTKRTISLNYQLIVRPYFWIPEDTMRQHEKEDGVPYQEWVNRGLVTPTPGVVIDYNRIYQDITTKILPRYPLLKQGVVGYDPAFATDIAIKLRDVAGLKICEVLQNYKMFSEPSQVIEALIKGKRVIHDGHRVLRNHWENVTVKTDDAGRIRPVKPKKPSKRVDGAIAMIMGNAVLSLQPARPAPQFQMLILGRGRYR